MNNIMCIQSMFISLLIQTVRSTDIFKRIHYLDLQSWTIQILFLHAPTNPKLYEQWISQTSLGTLQRLPHKMQTDNSCIREELKGPCTFPRQRRCVVGAAPQITSSTKVSTNLQYPQRKLRTRHETDYTDEHEMKATNLRMLTPQLIMEAILSWTAKSGNQNCHEAPTIIGSLQQPLCHTWRKLQLGPSSPLLLT